MFDHLSNYQAANPALWQGREDTKLKERFFQKISFTDELNQILSGPPKTIFIGFASDEGIVRNQGRSGAQFGPDEIKTQLAKLPCTSNQNFIDLGSILCTDGDLETAQTQFASLISLCHQHGHKTIGLGGGHEIAWAHYQGLAPFFSKLGIINFDAHFDLRPHRTGEPGTSGTPFSQIASFCAEEGAEFNYCCLGIQQMGNTPSLFKRAKDLNVPYILAQSFNEQDPSTIYTFIDNFINRVDHIYLTICLDVLAECFAPGVSAPQPLGLSPWQMLPVLKYIIKSGKVVSFDVAELSPPLDQDKKTARLAALIIAELLDIN